MTAIMPTVYMQAVRLRRRKELYFGASAMSSIPRMRAEKARLESQIAIRMESGRMAPGAK